MKMVNKKTYLELCKRSIIFFSNRLSRFRESNRDMSVITHRIYERNTLLMIKHYSKRLFEEYESDEHTVHLCGLLPILDIIDRNNPYDIVSLYNEEFMMDILF